MDTSLSNTGQANDSINLTQDPLPFPKQAFVFTCLHLKPFENTVGKGDIARNIQFLHFSVVSIPLENFLLFSSTLKLSSANSFSL